MIGTVLGSYADVMAGNARALVLHGDCFLLGDVIAENSIDALICDPPSGTGFMGKTWDSDKGGRDAWISWLTVRMEIAYRLLKPGAHALVWALPRTSHWTATAVENAGFEIRDVVMHLFGSGFPKSLNVSKAIDDALGAEREVVGSKMGLPGYTLSGGTDGSGVLGAGLTSKTPEQRLREVAITAPASPEAAQWEGWGTALKPACEHWILARKPLAGTVAHNVMAHGTGGLNVDGCRIYGARAAVYSGAKGSGGPGAEVYGASGKYLSEPHNLGRWPAHLVLSHLDECKAIGWLGDGERVSRDVYRCAPGCPVAMLDEQSGVQRDGVAVNRNKDPGADKPHTVYGGGWKNGARPDVTFGGVGGASRFFYTAKPARSEKEAGLHHLPVRAGSDLTGREEGSAGIEHPRAGAGARHGARNGHPTVKPVDLMRWLVRLVTPPRGIVLDMFAGSGTTLVAGLEEDMRVIGCELDEQGEYMPILIGRVVEALGRHKQLGLAGVL